MTSVVRHITFDCAEPYQLAEFWSRIVGRPVHPDDKPGDDEVGLAMPEGQPMLLFIRVPEPKAVKNRVHLDLEPDQPRDREVARIQALGAPVLDDRRQPNGRGWVVFADPAGNEFCVEASAAERAVFIREEEGADRANQAERA